MALFRTDINRALLVCKQTGALRPPHTSRFFVGRQKIFTYWLMCDKIGACRAIFDRARSQNVLSGLVG